MGFNPLDYVDGKAMGKHLRSNRTAKPPSMGDSGPPIKIAGGKKARLKRVAAKRAGIPPNKV